MEIGRQEIRRCVSEMCKKVEGGLPNGWKEENIASIEKKLEGGKVLDYRGVNLMPILYTSILAEKLIEEVEE